MRKINLNIKNILYTIFLLGVSQVALADNVSGNNSDASAVSTTNTNPNTTTKSVDTSDDNFHRFFVNGAIGGGIANSNDGSSYGGGFAGMVNVGFNFNKTFAIEGGYTGTSSTPDNLVVNSILGIPTLNYSLYDLAMRSTLHLGQYFSFYGKVGGAIEQANWTQGSFWGQNYQPGPNTTSFGALLGGGASVDLGPIGIFLEFDQYLAITGQNAATPANLSLINLGLQYNF